MATVKHFYEYIYDLSYPVRMAHTRELVKMRVGGMSYKDIAAMIGVYRPDSVSKYLKHYEQLYRQEVRDNLQRLEDSIRTPDPDYVYMTDKRTVLQEMCALTMGGAEVVSTLEQLMNVKGISNE